MYLMNKIKYIHSFSFFVLAIIFLSGCTAMQTLKEDYLHSDEFNEFTMREAIDKIKTDYLGVEKLDDDARQKAELIAYDYFITTEYISDYEALDPTIDDAIQMPEALPYFFIHFFSKDNNIDIAQTSYLVVVNRYYNNVEYSGVYTLPKGDPFYRYHNIIKKINN